MSANNVYVIKEHNGTWYGWDVTAEQSVTDHDEHEGKRVLRYDTALYTAESERELKHMMNESDIYGSEYGFTTNHLPKDGTPIEFVE